MPSGRSADRLSKEQKTGFVLLLVFGLLAIGMGFLQMRNTIYLPFVTKPKQQVTAAPPIVDETASLQAIDTDQDGLTNYEELFFYETSPYLPDTDSDGTDDKTELAKGTNPNCAEGKECALELSVPTSTRAEELKLPDAGSPLDILGNAGMITQPDAQALQSVAALFENPQQLRALLRQTGQLTEEQLAQIDDATLMILVEELFTEQRATTTITSSTQ